MARQQNDSNLETLINVALAAAAREVGDNETAVRYIQEIDRNTLGRIDPANRPRVAINIATTCSVSANADCLPEFQEAIQQAIDAGDLPTLAYAHHALGSYLISRGSLPEAERALTEACRLRRLLHSSDIVNSYTELGRVYLASHRPESALVLFDRAIRDAKPNSEALHMSLLAGRGAALADLGRLPEAVAALGDSLRFARVWRSAISPADASRVSSNIKLDSIYTQYIEAAMRLYGVSRDGTLARQAFLRAEENRALSFREKLISNLKLPPHYWQVAAKLHEAQQQAAAHGSSNSADLHQLRLELQELEAQAGRANQPPVPSPLASDENISPDFALARYRRFLRAQEALLSFHIGENESYLWALTDQSFEVRVLPGRAALHRMLAFVPDMTKGLERGSSQPVYREIFGQLSAAVRSRREWIFELEEGLFQVPFGALITGRSADGSFVYLAEERAIRILPSAELLENRPPQQRSTGFLGIGDPVFNTADQRLPHPHSAAFSLFAAPPTLPGELPRLPATRAEIRSCARAWQESARVMFASTLLDGKLANRKQVLHALQAGPAITHFATHVVSDPNLPDSTQLALGLDDAGRADFLAPLDIANRHFSLGLVVMNACSSGAGGDYPGAGLFGLSRAWLLAGAQAVIATHWATPDDTGAFFDSLYSQLGKDAVNAAAASRALQRAQIQMIRSNSWRAEPRFWASFFVIGKD